MKIYEYSQDRISTAIFYKMYLWCQDQFGEDENGWTHQYPTFYFRNEKDYLIFLLKWS